MHRGSIRPPAGPGRGDGSASKSDEQTENQTGADQASTSSGSATLSRIDSTASGIPRVGRCQVCRAQQVSQHMDRDEDEPEDEAHLVQPEHRVVRRSDQPQDNAGPEENDRRDHEERPEQTKQRVRRSRSTEPRIVKVVLAEAPQHRCHLHQERGHKDEPDQDVPRHQPTDERDR